MLLNYYIYILFIPMMLISVMLTLISNSWFSMWMIMELNLFSMIMLLIFDKNIKYELLMKYYLLQSFLSYLYLINILGLFNNVLNINSLMIMLLSMLLKLSIFPFHFWYIKIMMNLNWNNIYFFSIINKLIPLYILNNIFNFNNYYINMMMYLLLLISSFFSSILAINHINLKLIISFSSMIQLSWIIILMNFNELISLIYFIIYNFISLNIFIIFYFFNINNLNQINSLKYYKNNFILSIFFIMLLSLSSLPPLFGFLMKWISVNFFIDIKLNFYYILLFIFNSLISMFFYLRIIFNIMMNYYLINKINFKFINKFNLMNNKMIYLNWLLLMLILAYMFN